MRPVNEQHGLGPLFGALSAVVLPGRPAGAAHALQPLSGAATRRQILADATGQPSRFWLRLGTWLNRAGQAALVWHQRVEGRRELMRLDDHVLADIGLSPAEAEAEWRKPFWRA